MRRGKAVVAWLAAITLGLGGCTVAPTVGDGDLGVDWATMPTPAVPPPPTGACTVAAGPAPKFAWDLPLFTNSTATPDACKADHLSETYYVGGYAADADADGTARPKVGSVLFRQAYETCAQKATDFLGGDVHTARVQILPVVPSETQWAGHARWYRCEMLEVANAAGDVKSRTTSLRDGLRGAKPLALTCANNTLSSDQKFIENITFADCSTAHDVELTGVYTAPDTDYPGDATVQSTALDACYGVGAQYLGMTRATLNSTGGVSWSAWGGDKNRWLAGDRSFWCFMGEFPSRKLTGSIAGRKPGSFPH
jgi:hypothetical protein